MTSKEVKKFFKDNFPDLKLRVHTIPCKAKWIQVWIRYEKQEGNGLVYTQSFDEKFRRICMKVVYPNSPVLCAQETGGNIKLHSISMLPDEWASAILKYLFQ